MAVPLTKSCFNLLRNQFHDGTADCSVHSKINLTDHFSETLFENNY